MRSVRLPARAWRQKAEYCSISALQRLAGVEGLLPSSLTSQSGGGATRNELEGAMIQLG